MALIRACIWTLLTGLAAGMSCAAPATARATPRKAEIVLEEAPQVVLARGADAFARQAYVEAARTWESVLPRLEDEAAALAKLLPLLGFAHLRAGDGESALAAFTRWLQSARALDPARGFVEFACIEARILCGDAGSAAVALERLAAEQADPFRAAFLRWRQATILATSGAHSPTAAWAALENAQECPPTFRAAARAALLAAALESEDTAHIAARARLSLAAAREAERGRPADGDRFEALREVRLLALAAEHLSSNGDPVAALDIYRALPDRAELARQLTGTVWMLADASGGGPPAAPSLSRIGGASEPESGGRRASSTGGNGDPARAAPSAGFPEDFLAGVVTTWRREQVERLRQEASAVLESPDPSSAIRLRIARELLRLDRPREAWLLAEALSESDIEATEIREAAHVTWALAALACRAWEESVLLVRAFRVSYPHSPRLTDLLRIAARAHQGAGNHVPAIETLNELETRLTDPGELCELRLDRARCHMALRDWPAALADLRGLEEQESTPVWRARAALWRIRVHAFARDHAAALRDAEAALKAGHPAAYGPEFEHRAILALRLLKRPEEAEQRALEWLERNSGHFLSDEIALLAGDLALGRGDFEAARKSYARIADSSPGPFAQAHFQIGKALRAMSNWEALERHHAAYLAKGGARTVRFAEALHWQGYAWEKLGHPARAVACWEAALEAHGDSRDAREIPAVIARLAKARGSDADARVWLDTAREAAHQAERHTLYARLTMERAGRERRQSMSRALREELAARAPVAALDAPALLATAQVLADIDPRDSRMRFERLLEFHPRSPEALEARVGLANLERAQNRLHEAEALLRQALSLAGAHPRRAQAHLALSDLLLHTERPAEAADEARQVLAIRAARGRTHASALRVLADAAFAEGREEESLLLLQRLYALHGAQRDLAAAAMLDAAAILARSERTDEAVATLRELLATAARDEPGVRLEAHTRLRALGSNNLLDTNDPPTEASLEP
jgi:tetratricopeptide (TPR) repeat protein